MNLTSIDLIILIAYILFIIAIGMASSRVKTVKDYFLGGRRIPWVVACFSIVATETSTLTFISLPGLAYIKGVGFLQIGFGYIIGRIAVSLILLPRYFAGDIETVYHFLQNRFSFFSRRVLSVIFHITRLLGDGIRLFCTAIPLSMLLGLGDNYYISVLIIGAATLVYTYYGGIRSVAVVDTIQLCLYMICAIIGIYVVVDLVPGTLQSIVGRIPSESLTVISSGLENGFHGIFNSYNIFSGIIGGAVLTFATHGTDQLLVQRVLSCKDLKSAQKAMIGSGILVVIQFAVFLLLGLFIKILLDGQEFTIPDQIMPYFILHHLPEGIRGLMLAGIFAVAMSTLSSSINSLSASTSMDLLQISDKEMPENRKVFISRMISLFWTAALIVVSLLFQNNRSPLVELVLGLASITGGGILGIFILGSIWDEFYEKAALTGVVVSIIAVSVIAALKIADIISISWPWYAPIGFIISVSVSILLNRILKLKA